jgi:hypothetical protein
MSEDFALNSALNTVEDLEVAVDRIERESLI